MNSLNLESMAVHFAASFASFLETVWGGVCVAGGGGVWEGGGEGVCGRGGRGGIEGRGVCVVG